MHQISGATAVFSDVHGNSVALNRMLEIAGRLGADNYLFLGDAIGYSSDTDALRTILSIPDCKVLAGNHEEMLLAERQLGKDESVYRLEQVAQSLSLEEIQVIARFPVSLEFRFGRKATLAVHGSPLQPTNGYVYEDTPLPEFGYDMVLLANTHRPFIRWEGSICCVNTGSVGLPRDDGRYGSFALIQENGTPEILRFEIGDTYAAMDESDPFIADAVKALRVRRAERLRGRVVA